MIKCKQFNKNNCKYMGTSNCGSDPCTRDLMKQDKNSSIKVSRYTKDRRKKESKWSTTGR